MFGILFLLLALAILLRLCWLFWCYLQPRQLRRRGKKVAAAAAPVQARNFPQAKPDWAKAAVIDIYLETKLSHRKLAMEFNRRYQAKTGISVGRTWVRELLIAYEHGLLQAQLRSKHSVPRAMANNIVWAFDATFVRVKDTTLQVLGAIDHGSRVNLLLLQVPSLNGWTFLGYIFLAIGKYGKPRFIKTDNGPAFRAKLVRQVLGWFGIRQQFSAPGKPWQNGRIERFFGTLKPAIKGLAIIDAADLQAKLNVFQDWYNRIRPHQHLLGQTPLERWHGVDYRKRVVKSWKKYEAWEGRLVGYVLRC